MRPRPFPEYPRRVFLTAALPVAASLAGCATGGQSAGSRSRARRPREAARELRLAPAESLVQGLRRAREAGYRSVLLPARAGAEGAATLASVRVSNVRWAVEMAGCAPLGVYAPLDGLPAGSLMDAQARTDAGALLALRDAVELCASLGGRVVVLGGGAQRSDLSGGDRAAARARFAKRLLVAASWAADRKLQLLLDPLPAAETNIINTPAEAIALVRSVDHPALGVALTAADIDAPAAREALSRSSGGVKLVRIEEAYVAGSPGRVADLREALDDAGYRGWLSVAEGAGALEFARL